MTPWHDTTICVTNENHKARPLSLHIISSRPWPKWSEWKCHVSLASVIKNPRVGTNLCKYAWFRYFDAHMHVHWKYLRVDCVIIPVYHHIIIRVTLDGWDLQNFLSEYSEYCQNLVRILSESYQNLTRIFSESYQNLIRVFRIFWDWDCFYKWSANEECIQPYMDTSTKSTWHETWDESHFERITPARDKSLQHLVYEISRFSKVFLAQAYEISDFL